MAMVHIVPEAKNTYEQYAKCNNLGEKPFPLPYLLVIAGYILILIIDRWLAASFHLDGDKEDDAAAPEEQELS